MNIKELKNKIPLKFLSKKEKKTEGAQKPGLVEKPVTEYETEEAPEEREVIKSFAESEGKWAKAYSPKALAESLTKYAKKAGITTVYYILLLYQSLLSNQISPFEKALVIAALGYFIAPVDFISDFLPGGLIDDTAILLYAINKLGEAITPEIEAAAKERLKTWFKEPEIMDISRENVEKTLRLKGTFKNVRKTLKFFGR